MSVACLHQARSSVGRPSLLPTRKLNVSVAISSRQQQCSPSYEAVASRRDALLQVSLVASWLAAGPTFAYANSELCSNQDSAEAAAECLAAELAKDKAGDKAGEYSKLSVGVKKSLAPNVPVSDLNTEYAAATKDLADKIGKYLTLDVYDKTRQPLIKSLKTDGSTWVSKYARGGSARTQSARNMYIAVDAVQGYLASNGLAPFPASKARVVSATLDKALAFLDEGR